MEKAIVHYNIRITKKTKFSIGTVTYTPGDRFAFNLGYYDDKPNWYEAIFARIDKKCSAIYLELVNWRTSFGKKLPMLYHVMIRDVNENYIAPWDQFNIDPIQTAVGIHLLRI